MIIIITINICFGLRLLCLYYQLYALSKSSLCINTMKYFKTCANKKKTPASFLLSEDWSQTSNFY